MKLDKGRNVVVCVWFDYHASGTDAEIVYDMEDVTVDVSHLMMPMTDRAKIMFIAGFGAECGGDIEFLGRGATDATPWTRAPRIKITCPANRLPRNIGCLTAADLGGLWARQLLGRLCDPLPPTPPAPDEPPAGMA